MKLIYDQRTDRRELTRLVTALINALPDGPIDPFGARIETNKATGIDIDHHEYSMVLDQMTRTPGSGIRCLYADKYIKGK